MCDIFRDAFRIFDGIFLFSKNIKRAVGCPTLSAQRSNMAPRSHWSYCAVIEVFRLSRQEVNDTMSRYKRDIKHYLSLIYSFIFILKDAQTPGVADLFTRLQHPSKIGNYPSRTSRDLSRHNGRGVNKVPQWLQVPQNPILIHFEAIHIVWSMVSCCKIEAMISWTCEYIRYLIVVRGTSEDNHPVILNNNFISVVWYRRLVAISTTWPFLTRCQQNSPAEPYFAFPQCTPHIYEAWAM
jgi:hypothetical protein